MFNVLTNEEIVSLLRSTLQSLPAPRQVVFLDQRCEDCGEEGDRRLLSPFCHLEKCLRHPGRLQRVHPGGVELYHLSEEQVTLHPGHLKSPWYRDCLPNTTKRWSCCKVRPAVLQCPAVPCYFICDYRELRVRGAARGSTCAADRTRERKAVARGSPAVSDRPTSVQAALAVSSSSPAAAGEPRPRVARRPASSVAGGGASPPSTATGGNTG